MEKRLEASVPGAVVVLMASVFLIGWPQASPAKRRSVTTPQPQPLVGAHTTGDERAHQP